MSMSIPPRGNALLSMFCGRCGGAVAAGAPFCGRCGNPVAPSPPAAGGYTYPVLPPATVPGAQRKLPPRRLIAIAVAALVILVTLITLVVVVARPSAPGRCIFACGPPQQGTELISNSAIHNDHWGYTVDFSTNALTVASTDTDTVTLSGGSQGLPLVRVRGVSGTDVKSALQNEISGLGSQQFQVQPQGDIPGAQVGEILGSGTFLSGTYELQGGAPVSVQVIAATRNNVTIVVTIADSPSQQNSVSGISNWDLDYVLSELRWPGQ